MQKHAAQRSFLVKINAKPQEFKFIQLM